MIRRLSLAALVALAIMLPRAFCASSPEQEQAELWGNHWRENLAAWRHAKTPAAKRRLGEVAIDSAMHAADGPRNGDHPEVVEEVLAGGQRQLREGEIRVPPDAERVLLKPVWRFGDALGAQAGDGKPVEGSDWLARRITADAFEVWSPKHGWLFDRHGQLLNEAKPPRRDGVGRQWFGAFLPDGRWVTTDLWEWDRVLTFFSREGKWLKEIPGAVLVPRTEEEKDRWLSTGDFIISWARSDKDGRGWIVQVGTDGGRGWVWIGPEGCAQPLTEDEGRGWNRCYPRQLGPRGSLYWSQVPSDSRKVTLGFHVLSHGAECGYPQYFTGESPDYGATVRVPDGTWNYGFWPGSTSFFVVATHDLPPIKGGAPDEQSTYPTEERTWFFDRDTDFQGWIRATRLADGADGRTMLFSTADGRVVTLDRNRRVRRVERFVFARKGNGVEPLTLFPDLRLGLFRERERIVLARWAAKSGR